MPNYLAELDEAFSILIYMRVIRIVAMHPPVKVYISPLLKLSIVILISSLAAQPIAITNIPFEY